jgi:nucleoside-diphosphate-sugar epimerase
VDHQQAINLVHQINNLLDFLHPSDFYKLVSSLLAAPATNTAVDCYTLAPIDKQTLLTTMQEKFGLQYEVTAATAAINATGSKPHYFSLNKRAADFGYAPSLTSQEGITREVEALFKRL